MNDRDARLLATVLGYGRGRDAALALAAGLRVRFGGLQQLLTAPRDAVAAEHGVGPATADLLLALPGIGRRFFESAVDPGQMIRSPADTEAFLLSRLGHLGHERFCCLYLDNRHRVLKFDELFRGTIDGTSVYPREVVKEALQVNAAALIIAHNHPSGVAEPSSADERITQRLKAALELVDIRLQLGEVIVWIEVLDADGKLGLHRVDRAAGPFPDAGFAMVDAGVGVGRIVHCEVRF